MTERTYTAEFASGVRAQLIVSPGRIDVFWSPDFPREFTGQRRRRFLAAYRAWRNECLADFSKHTGAPVLVIDL